MCTANPHFINRHTGAMDGSDSTDHLLMTWGANDNGTNVRYDVGCLVIIIGLF